MKVLPSILALLALVSTGLAQRSVNDGDEWVWGGVTYTANVNVGMIDVTVQFCDAQGNCSNAVIGNQDPRGGPSILDAPQMTIRDDQGDVVAKLDVTNGKARKENGKGRFVPGVKRKGSNGGPGEGGGTVPPVDD